MTLARYDEPAGRGLVLPALWDPLRSTPKPLGWATDSAAGAARELLGLAVDDARTHVHALGPTGVGKSTWLSNSTLAEAACRRGVALLDPQGDLAAGVLERLPAECGERLVIIDPDEHAAPPAFNPLQVQPGGSPELAAENVVGTIRRLYAAMWGPRMDDTLRAACLTLAHRPGSTLADVVPLLTEAAFRDRVLAGGVPLGLESFWRDWATLSTSARVQACGPIVARLRAVFTRPFVRDLLGAPTSTFALSEILDGGVLVARLPKGVLGDDCCRLVGSLLLAGLWQATTARAARPAEQRPDATIYVDEAHNFLHLPIGVADALAEARGYRVSWVLAHQHLAQLTREITDAIDANARNKVWFTLSPKDAAHLAHHVAPWLDADDLSRRPAWQITCRITVGGASEPPFTVDAPAPAPAVPGRAEQLRAQARRRTGLDRRARASTQAREVMAARPGARHLQDPAPDAGADPGTPPEGPAEPEGGPEPEVTPIVWPDAAEAPALGWPTDPDP